MLQFYLFMPFLVGTSSKKQLSIAALISSLSIGLFSYLMYVKGIQIPLYIYAGTLPIWIMFFCLGIYLSKIKREYNLFPFIVGALVFLLLSIFETEYYINHYGQLSGIGYKVTNFWFSFFFILILMSKKVETLAQSIIVAKVLAWLGRNSLGIYFVHYPLLVFFLCHIRTTWLGEFTLCLLMSTAVILISRKILSDKVNLIMGFR